MWRPKLILILSVVWLVLALAQTDPNSSTEEYKEFPDELTIRKFPQLFGRGKIGKQSSESSPIQRYWQNFVRNIPPLRWNMTNSLGNLFNAATQDIMETPISNNYDINRNRKRKTSNARKPVIKKNNPRRAYHLRAGNDYVYNYAASHNPYGHMQLQAVGLDQQNVMHFLDPRSGQYYALNMVTSPNQYGQQDYYGTQHLSYGNNDQEFENDSYYSDDNYSYEVQTPHRHYAYEQPEDSEEDEDSDDHSLPPHSEYEQHYPIYNEYDKYAEESVESGESYADDVQVADNWGYSDEDTYSERKLKLSLIPIKLRPKDDNDSSSKGALKSSIIKLQKSMLKPETEKDVMVLLTNNHKRNQKTPKPPSRPSEDEKKQTSMKRIKPSKKSPEGKEMESVRNVLGTHMKDDVVNRQRQRSSTKAVKQRFVERPRGNVPNYFYPRFW